MLNRVSLADFSPNNYAMPVKKQKIQNNASPVSFQGYNVAADKLSRAYRGYNNINMASTVSFTGSGLSKIFDDLNRIMVTCEDKELKQKGTEVGSRADVSGMLTRVQDDLPKYDDAIKTTIAIEDSKDSVTDARTQIKKGKGDNMKFEMVVRTPRKHNEYPGWTDKISQRILIETTPDDEKFVLGRFKKSKNAKKENAYVLNTKGKLMAVVEDGDDVLLTNAGSFQKKNKSEPALNVFAEQNKNVFHPFKVENVPEVVEKTGGSEGGGTEIIIGLENGRFVPEIIDSVATFCQKVEDGEIVLDKFSPAKNAQSIQISMLAGGYGSRAEYANASSSKIFHGEENGSNLTKGCFRTATGLTPMETTFVSLHNAGLLDCSKGNLQIGDNIKFYINDSKKNTGNGGFTIDMYNAMEREGRDSIFILPNDAMSRIPNALDKASKIMNKGDAAVVMIAKEVDKEDARGSLGIMKINDRGEIEAFAEKPKEFEEGYVDKNDKCFANTFQFAVSKEAFEALSLVEPYLPPTSLGKESRDWSNVLTPVLMSITQNDDPKKMQKEIKAAMEKVKDFKGKGYGKVPPEVLEEAKDILGNQKMYAVKTNEPWADCGTLNALYHTTMQIASGDFPLEDFERKHVLDSIDTETGLVASTPEQKERIENKYNVRGQVMVVPKAEPVSKDVVDDYDYAITRYTDKF